MGIDRNKAGVRGFTLMEMLIVIAIVAVLVTIAIPVFIGQVDNAKVAVDQSNVRSAKSVASSEFMLGDLEGDSTWYYDASTSELREDSTGIAGYGQYTSDDKTDEIGATGTPNSDGTANMLRVTISKTGAISMAWVSGGLSYKGLGVTNAEQLNSLSPEERVELDTILVDSLEAKLRSMTYGEILEMAQAAGLPTGNNGRNTAYKLALSTIMNSDGSVSTNPAQNTIYASDLFSSIGYDMDRTASEQYLMTSMQGYYTTIWVDVGTALSQSTSDDVKNQLADSAFVYVKGGTNGVGATFEYDYRKNRS